MSKICKLLLVEDQCDMQDLLRELFASEGYRFIIVGDGAEMRRTLDDDPAIDAVIIDILLPGGVDGLALADEVAARGLPAIIVTGDHTQCERLLESGHRHLLKPFGLESFVALIEDVLRQTKTRCERDIHGTSIYAFASKKHGGTASRDAFGAAATVRTVQLPD